MKFDKPPQVAEVVYQMREANRGRGDNRAILEAHFNGDPPFDESTAEENGVQINRNFLKGVQVLADARRQWNQAMMGEATYFTVTLDSGPINKRADWSETITTEANRALRECRAMVEMVRETGAGVVLHGVAPCIWSNKSDIVPEYFPQSSLLIPSDTKLSFRGLPYHAVFREYSPGELARIVSKEKVDPGWNMDLLQKRLSQLATDKVKNRSTIDSYMPERVIDRMKQDGGYWESDAVGTLDCWDFYFTEEEDGPVYRRILLDDMISDNPQGDTVFLYDSKERPYAEDLSQVIHCNFGDCSASPPFKYHSVRSLGWMIWGVCDLLNRMECRFTEAAFENLMWFFRTSSTEEFERLKKASFTHMGIIPNGINFVPGQERYIPNAQIIELSRNGFRQQISEVAASYTSDFDKGSSRTQLTATETMARVNSVNALVAGMMTLAYVYETFKYQEMCRRLVLGKHAIGRKFKERVMRKGVPEEYLDTERWNTNATRVIGAGNKTVQMAAVGFLQNIRPNLEPTAQRKVDHLSISAVTDQPDLARELAPIDEKQISNSVHDAEESVPRIMLGLEFTMRPDMVREDYLVTWLKDLMGMVNQAMVTQQVDAARLVGFHNLEKQIGQTLQELGQNPTEKPKIKVYADALGNVMNLVKGLEQRFLEQQKAQAQAGDNGAGAEAAAKAQANVVLAESKARINEQSHSQKAAQNQVAFEKQQARLDEQNRAQIARENERFQVQLQKDLAKAAVEQQKLTAQLEAQRAANEAKLEAAAEATTDTKE